VDIAEDSTTFDKDAPPMELTVTSVVAETTLPKYVDQKYKEKIHKYKSYNRPVKKMNLVKMSFSLPLLKLALTRIGTLPSKSTLKTQHSKSTLVLSAT
jgi:hypothetical protein